MKNHRYTEQDLQDFLQGTFRGDREAFEKWVQQDQTAQQALEHYKLVFSELALRPEYKLSYNLEEKVLQKLRERPAKNTAWTWAMYAALAVGIAVLVVCWKALELSDVQIDTGLFVGSAIITVCFAGALHLIELHKRRQKFRFFVGTND